MSGLFDDIPYEKKKSTITSGLFDDIPYEGKGVAGHAKDAGLHLLKGAISVPELAVGLADIPTGGRVGKLLENEGGLVGFRPKEAKGILSRYHTEQYKQQQQDFADADGILGKAKVAVQNPSLITGTLLESAPAIGAGGVGARGIMAATRLGQAGATGAAAAAGIGEGAVMSGMQASELRGETEDGLLSPMQSVAALGTGVVGGLIGWGGGRLAQKLGIGDIDVMIAQGIGRKEIAGEIAKAPAKSIPRQIIEGAISEGFLQELPQEVSEQVIQNLALGEPWHEGIEDAAVMGTLAGMVMGGGAAGAHGYGQRRSTVQPQPTDNNPNPAPVERPDPANGPLSKAASKMPEPTLDQGALERAGVTPPPVFDEQALQQHGVSTPEQDAAARREAQQDIFGRPTPPATLHPEILHQSGVTPPPVLDTDLVGIDTFQTQRPRAEEKQRSPEEEAATAWDSMSAFERGAAAKGSIDSVSSVVGKSWSALTDEQRTRLIGAVNQQQGSRWTDPNRRATDQSGPVLQPRDRSQQASISQMLNIAKAPDYAKASYSRTFTDGAPVTIDEIMNLPAEQRGRQESVTTASDRKIPVQYAVVEAGQLLPSNNISGASNAEYSTGGQGKSRAIAGNGRVAGLTEAWKRGTADQYKADMMADDAHGISPEVIQAMKRPVLVRLMPQSEVTDDIGDLSNRDGKLDTGVVEQAKEDGRSIDLASLAYDAEGGIGGDTVKDFVSRLPGASNLVSNGKVTQEARDRLAAAVFQKAYNNDALTELLTERGEGARSVINAMALAAPHMTRLEGAGVFDIRDLVAQAGEIALTAAREGRSLQSHIQQLDMGVDPHVYPILEMMVNDKGGIRSAKYIAEQLVNLANLAHYEASQTGTDMFGERPARSTEQLISDAFEGVTGNVQQAEQATADSEQSGSEEDLGQPGRPEPADQVDEGREGGRERPEDAGRTAQAEQPTEVEQARPVEIQRTEDGKSIRVYGDRAEVRSQLRAAGIRLPGAEIDGGLSFAARLEAQIRDVLGVQEQVEEELTSHADDVPVDDGRELEPATQDDRVTTGKAFVERLLRKAEPAVEVTNLDGKRVEITTRTMKAGIFKSERDTLTKIGDNGGRNFDHQEITDDGNREETWSVRRTGKYQGDQGITAMHQVIKVLGEATPEQDTKWRSNYMQAMQKAREVGLDTAPLKGRGLKALVDAIDAHEQGQSFNLQTQTEEELAQQEADRKAQTEAEAKQKAKAEAEAKRKKDEQNTKARADDVVDDFQLGQSSDEAMSGMGDMFSQPEQQEAGAFGPIFRQFRHDARGAIEHLRKQQTGEAIAALHHPDVGDIDLVWGKEGTAAREYEDGMGLAKIIKKHSEVLDDLQGFVGGLSVQKRSKNRVVLSDGSGKALVRLDWDGESKHWLLTAYDDSRKAPVTGEGRTGVSAGAESAPPADQGTEAEPSIPQAETAIIEDFGEKMSGTRKEQAQSMVSRVDAMSDDDIAASPLSKIWPKNEVDKIEDTFQAAAHHVIRSAIPSKPRDKYRLKAWVERVKAAKELSKEFAELGEGVTTAEMRKRMTLGPIADHIELLTNIDRKHWGRIDSVGIYQGRYQKDGEMVPGSWVQVKMDSRTRLFYGHDSVTSALQEIKNTIESSEPKQSKMKFAVYSHRSTGKAFISYDGDKEKRKLKEFDSVKEAHSYVSSNHDDLLAAWEAVKLRDNVTRKDVRQAANSQRVGPDYRNGKDVTPEAFLKAFGFRGVDFGKWVSQGRGGKERQGLLNDAHDALMDLASVLNLPPRALSLNGELGVGFGSRGRGGRAAAHYEPGNVVINLTKTQGAGSLAHEWFHALDHYFARQRTAPVDSKDWQSGYITFRPEPLYVVNPEKNPQRWSLQLTQAELKRRHKQSSESGFYDPDNWMPDPNHPEGVRPVVERAFAAVVEALDDSPMAKRARMIDQGASDGYWSRIIERGARGFETYVIAKLADTGARNDYLANVVSFERFARNPDRYPYLTTDEQGPVNEAFDALFGTIETRDGEDGNVVLFSFAGEKSGTAMHAELAKAKRLAARGVGNEDVRQATGWHRGTDGKWRYEISDHEAKLAVSGSTMGEVVDLATMNALADGRSEATIGDVMDHPALFRAYPELAKIKVRKMDGPSRTAIASVRAVGNTFTISLNPRAKGNYALSALIHELQHAIQTIEGFARGGNSRMAARLSNLSLSDKAAANAYMRLYGEVEARNTQARMQMNEEFRKLFPPSETQDVSDADAIVTFNGSEVQDFAAADAITEAQLRNVFAARFPKLVKALDGMLAKGDRRESGGLIILSTADPLKIAGQFSKATGRDLNESIRLFSNAEDAQGFFDPRSGLTFLVGPSVNETNAAAVVLHEAIHGQQNKRLDQAAVQMLVNRKQERNADTRAFLDRVVRRMAQAEGGVTELEAAAYIVEQAIMEGRGGTGKQAIDSGFYSWVERNLGQAVADLVRGFVRAYRQFALRNGLDARLTIDDMIQYAQASMKQSAKARAKAHGNTSIHHSFAGLRAEAADQHALASAQQRIESGEDAEAVRQDTGWFTGPDGKWRYEISDHEAKLKKPYPEKGQPWGDIHKAMMSRGVFSTVGSMLDHPALFAAYPHLADLSVTTQRGTGAAYERASSLDPAAIYIGEQVPMSDVVSKLLHEMQHAIQDRENFARGGNMRSVEREALPAFYMRLEGIIKRAEAKGEELARELAEVYAEEKESGEKRPDEVEYYQRAIAENQRLRQEMRDKINEVTHGTASREDAEYVYRRLAGEVEARNTQARQRMTDVERKATPPSQTADVADSDVIVVYNGTEMHSAPQPANADAARAEGRRQFEETERAYGGRAAYDKAKASGKTKLNYQQWVQVRTPAFKEWFGDWEYGNDQRRAGVLGAVQERSNTSGSGKGTAGVDTRTTGPAGREWRLDQDTGEPRVFYHGTKDEFTTFDLNHPNRKDSGWLGRGVYTASDQRLADMSAINKRGNSKRKVMPLFVNVRNPAVGSLDIKQKLRNASQEYIDEVTQSMRDRGYDGAVMELPDGTLELMAMNPADVKSATDNVGTFSADTNDIRFSRKAAQKAVDSLMGWAGKVDTHTNRKRAMPKGLSQEQQAAAGKFDTFTARTPLADAIQKVTGWNGKRFHQKVFDQFTTIGDYSHKAFMQAHLSKGSETTVETVVKHGTPYLKDGAIAIDTSKGGFLAALQKHLGSADEANRFFMYVAGKRSEELANEYTVFVNDKAVKTLKSQQEADRHASQLQAGGAGKVKVKHTSRENLFSSDDIAALTKLNAGKLDNGKSRPMAYAAMHQELLRYQKAMLDIAEKAGIVNADSRKDWESEFYVPFYRVMENEDGSVNHHLGASDTGMMRQEVIKRLKGGSENLGDPINNLIANWEQLLSSSMKNMAANEALRQAEQIGAARSIPAEEWAQYKRQHGKEADGTLWTLDNGQRVYWEVADKDLLESLTALNFQGYNNGLMRAAGAFKRLLTMGVTISPTFRIRSATRDILHALAVADVGYNPARNAIEGWKQTGKDSELMVQMLAGGGAIRFGSFTDGKSGDMTRKMIEQGIKGDQILNTPEKFKRFFGKAFTGYMELGDRLENNSRVAAYQRAMEKTGDHLVASFEARDIMNFTSMGSSAAVRALAQVLPFFNARLQGMSKLYRGAKNDPRRFWGVVGTIGAASALLYLLNADDDEYKALPNHVRDTYWPVKVGGKWVYIPKPFEVGSMASVIERFTELAVAGDDYQARDFRDTIFSILVNQLEMNPVPQIILPAAEAWYNYDMFRGQAIDSMAMERLMPGDRYDANTSAGAVAVGRMLNVSPKKLEHMVNGYFGWLGLQALNISDLLGRSMMDLPASTKRDMSQTNNWFIVGDFVKEPGSGASKYSARFYDVQRDINQIYATANYARSVGDLERYQELLSDPKMAARPMFQEATKGINNLNKQIRTVIADRNLTAAEKTERLKSLYQARESIAKRVDEKARLSR